MFASDIPSYVIWIAAALLGSIWGSFFNVAIHRWPLGMSVVSPPSHCPHCEAPIRALHNIPILSWLLLRGRAACCGKRISGRYPLVELLAAVLAVAIAERAIVEAEPGTTLLDASIEAAIYFGFVGGLIVATFVDLDWMEIPDEVSIPGAAVGLVTAPIREAPGAEAAAFGAGAGYLIVQLLFVWLYERFTGRRGMGEGDAKLLMMIGAFLGWKGALFALVAGAVQGLLVTIVALSTGHPLVTSPGPREALGGEDGGESDPSAKDEDGPMKIPFGPFLALAALEFLLFGNRILDAYFALLG